LESSNQKDETLLFLTFFLSMKTQTLLLGEYNSSVFSIYIKTETTTTIDYLSIEDLYKLFFHHSPNEISSLFYTIYQRYPNDFYRDHENKCYIAKQHVMTIAKSLHLYALAEFCTLDHDELMNRMADPLFAITNSLILRPVTPKRMTIDLDWFVLTDTSFFENYLNSAAQFLHPHPTNRYFPIQQEKNDHSWSRHFLPLSTMGTEQTIQAKRQQQAIIECRQRLSVYRSSGSHKLQLKKSSSERKRKSISPPPPLLLNHQQKKLKKSLYSNLDLLATQATKMKGLPLSPEISPPPPLPPTSTILSLPPISTVKSVNDSFHSSSFILPSIRNVLSDI
jgi:hypothetical protein